MKLRGKKRKWNCAEKNEQNIDNVLETKFCSRISWHKLGRSVTWMFFSSYAKNLGYRPGGVAQWTSHPPQEQKTRVRIPPGYKVFREKHSNAVVCNWLNMHCLRVYSINKGIGHKNTFFKKRSSLPDFSGADFRAPPANFCPGRHFRFRRRPSRASACGTPTRSWGRAPCARSRRPESKVMILVKSFFFNFRFLWQFFIANTFPDSSTP
jgi:hypothetical protein